MAELRKALAHLKKIGVDLEDPGHEIGPEAHSGGGYEIELVVQKIAPPEWELAGPPEASRGDFETAWDELSLLVAERDALSRQCARWYDAAISVRAEQILKQPPPGRTRRLRRLARLFRRDRFTTASALADRAFKSSQWETAARFYLDALASDPAVPELWLQLGHSLNSAGKSVEAEFAFRRAAALRSG